MEKEKMWAVLMHFGPNLWTKKEEIRPDWRDEECRYQDKMLLDRDTWRKVTDFLPECGINTILIDVGDGIRLDSHPELAIEGSWEKEEVREELNRLREMGLAPIPKLNFSTAHNAWLKEYAYMVGSETYYKVCDDVLMEVMEIFDYPEFFHLGMEEEIYELQTTVPVAIIRTPKKRTEDLHRLMNVCLSHGVRPWIWVDPNNVKLFGGDEAFRENIPKDVLISNFYYGQLYKEKFSENVLLYNKLDEWGYEQMPCSSNFDFYLNPRRTVNYCKDTLNPERLRGFLTTSWLHVIPENYYRIMDASYRLGCAKKRFYPEEM